MANFYVVGTPIGNMEDITLRALETFKNVDMIICEDTRVTAKLLHKYNIEKTTISYHSHSKISRINEIISLLKEGKNVAMVSDAGTPGISDPGTELIKIIREEMKEELKAGLLKIQAVPGPSALTAAISISGVPAADFVFLGFLPHKKGRQTLFEEISKSERTVIFYESPHRIEKTLESLAEYLQSSNKKVTIAREITKIFEEIVSGTAIEVKDYFSKNQDKVRGEFVVIVR